MEITVNHVSKTIKGPSILENADLAWTGGKIYGLQGPNGSGKTMLMRLITGLIPRERDRGALVVLTCHDTAVLERLSDEVCTVSEGRVERRAAL